MSLNSPTVDLPYRVGNFTFNMSVNPGYMTVYEFEKFDPVWTHRFLTANIPFGFIILGVYLVTVFALKRWMEDRERFELRKPLFLWNVGLAVLSVVMFYRFLPEIVYINRTHGFYASYCKQDYFNMATSFWILVYGLSKIVEFGDTMFILLRKQKLTFLHVFHHSSVYIGSFWGGLRVDPASRYFALLNSFVHSVMYSYFALKAAQVKLPRKVSIAITSVQLLQFLVGLIINSLVIYARVMDSKPYCERPDDSSIMYGTLAIIYLCLFGNFFVESYLRKPKSKAE